MGQKHNGSITYTITQWARLQARPQQHEAKTKNIYTVFYVNYPNMCTCASARGLPENSFVTTEQLSTEGPETAGKHSTEQQPFDIRE